MSLEIALERIRNAKKNNSYTLDLSNLKLTEIPPGLSDLSQLLSLDLSRNQLIKIKGLEKLFQLSELRLLSNQIKEIKGLEKLNKLTSLNLNQNKLTEIKGLEQLTQLTILSLEDNQITTIKDLENLIHLRKLSLGGNLLTELPEFLLELDQPVCWEIGGATNGIFVAGNPFINPPPEIVRQGTAAIEEYFNQRKKSGTELLREAKLILLGDGRSGKTSLANRLLGKELPEEKDRTLGVDIIIGKYSFPTNNGQEFKINIWDFAGQDKYKALHQLFYTDSSLYVMLAEAGNTTTDFDDWFQTAALFGEGSPLVLILNEFKDGIGSISFDSNYWKKQFPGLLKEVFTVNLRTKENMLDAEQYIQLLAQTLPHTKYAFPANWAAIRRVLNERRNEQYISLAEYLKICKANNLSEKESALILSSVLHRVGDLLHYQTNDLLKQFIILKNEWATEAVYKVLDDKIVAEEKCGFFSLADTTRIWSNLEYEDMRPQLLELMKKFKLAYELPCKDKFVTPPLLPAARPENFSWPGQESLELYIEYEFLPKALLTQFIVTRYADIANGRTLVWRHGVVLSWKDEALAEVSKIKLQGKDIFHIKTQGKNRKGMMTEILRTFRELHSEYKGIKPTEKVPCPCSGCKMGKNKQHYFDLETLHLRVEKGRMKVECDRSLETLNVRKLLDNSFVFAQSKKGGKLELKDVRNRRLKLFLASSNELAQERREIEIAISRKNDRLREERIFIDLLLWEDGKCIGKFLRSQDNYNEEIQQCHVFAMLFYSKVGKYTLEEFKKAKTLFESNAAPRICIFQKNINLPNNQSKADADSRFNFLEILKELEHFVFPFENTDKLTNELEKAIDKLLKDEAFIKGLTVE